MEIIEALQDFGLSEKEARVYITGLELGSSSAGDIAIKSSIPRTLVYDLLEKLIVLGLVSYSISDNKKIFTMVDPSELQSILERKTKNIKSVLPELKKLSQIEGIKRPKVEIFEGKKSVRTLLDSLLVSENKELLVYGGSRALYDLDPFFIEKWHKERVKLKISIRRLFDDIQEIREKVKNESSTTLSKFKFLEGETNAPTPTIVCNDKVLLLHLDKTKYYAVFIEDMEMAKNYVQFFERLWKIATK